MMIFVFLLICYFTLWLSSGFMLSHLLDKKVTEKFNEFRLGLFFFVLASENIAGAGHHRVVSVLDHVLCSLTFKKWSQLGPLPALLHNKIEYDQILVEGPTIPANGFIEVVVPVFSALFWRLKASSFGVEEDQPGDLGPLETSLISL
jgi:hypothetical protein